MNRNLRSNKFNTLAYGNEQLARAQRPELETKTFGRFFFLIRFTGNKSITFFRVELDYLSVQKLLESLEK